jgi:hypothetical protein
MFAPRMCALQRAHEPAQTSHRAVFPYLVKYSLEEPERAADLILGHGLQPSDRICKFAVLLDDYRRLPLAMASRPK